MACSGNFRCLVDDWPGMADITRKLLAGMGYSVITKSDTTAALDALATKPASISSYPMS